MNLERYIYNVQKWDILHQKNVAEREQKHLTSCYIIEQQH